MNQVAREVSPLNFCECGNPLGEHERYCETCRDTMEERYAEEQRLIRKEIEDEHGRLE